MQDLNKTIAEATDLDPIFESNLAALATAANLHPVEFCERIENDRDALDGALDAWQSEQVRAEDERQDLAVAAAGEWYAEQRAEGENLDDEFDDADLDQIGEEWAQAKSEADYIDLAEAVEVMIDAANPVDICAALDGEVVDDPSDTEAIKTRIVRLVSKGAYTLLDIERRIMRAAITRGLREDAERRQRRHDAHAARTRSSQTTRKRAPRRQSCNARAHRSTRRRTVTRSSAASGDSSGHNGEPPGEDHGRRHLAQLHRQDGATSRLPVPAAGVTTGGRRTSPAVRPSLRGLA